jgi:enterochelin esterase-like enzyme
MDPGTEGDGPVTIGPTYPSGPAADLTDRGNTRGRSFRFDMNSADSMFYKGDDTTLNASSRGSFTRRIDVYVPAAFKVGSPAPFLVIHDGPGQLGLVSRALDNLTLASAGERRLPAFVAIAVANGGGDSKGSRRGLEYDTMSDRFARFIHEEVLPAVENHADIQAEYPGFELTTDPEGRATMGCSSGGAAALTMGWFRPDLFRRLITYSGTFVDQQDDDAAEEGMYPLGAWEYHSGLKLIESTERKPLRIFLHHSDADNGAGQPESGHHNWVMANQRTAEVLKAKGYHYRHLTAENAGHCAGKVFDATLADTLVWAWRGFPLN